MACIATKQTGHDFGGSDLGGGRLMSLTVVGALGLVNYGCVKHHGCELAGRKKGRAPPIIDAPCH
jgi:hypothetical protein